MWTKLLNFNIVCLLNTMSSYKFYYLCVNEDLTNFVNSCRYKMYGWTGYCYLGFLRRRKIFSTGHVFSETFDNKIFDNSVTTGVSNTNFWSVFQQVWVRGISLFLWQRTHFAQTKSDWNFMEELCEAGVDTMFRAAHILRSDQFCLDEGGWL